MCFLDDLQLLKVYALARVNPAALRQLLSSMGINAASSMPQPAAAAAQPAAASPAAAKAASRQSRSSVASAGSAAGGKGAAAGAPSPAAVAASTAEVAAAAAAPEPGTVPPDEVLSGSNIYSTAEACLLAWMNAHAVKAFPKLVRVIVMAC